VINSSLINGQLFSFPSKKSVATGIADRCFCEVCL